MSALPATRFAARFRSFQFSSIAGHPDRASAGRFLAGRFLATRHPDFSDPLLSYPLFSHPDLSHPVSLRFTQMKVLAGRSHGTGVL